LYGVRVPQSAADSLVEALLAAPAGVALLAGIDEAGRREVDAARVLVEGATESTVDRVSRMSFGELVACALQSARSFAGPWNGDAPRMLTNAYRMAPGRRPMAEAIVARFGSQLSEPVRRESQEWWDCDDSADEVDVEAAFRDLTSVYGNGEFPWEGLWTVTDPPDEAHTDIVGAWDFFPKPVSRWRVPVTEQARVFEINAPEDWVRLVETYPKVAPGPHYGWELPGPNQRVAHPEELLELSGQHAARASRTVHLLPDWTAVAEDCDGIHLTWAGFLTTEGFVSDLGDGGVTMLRYWASERTLWLSDVFGEPIPLTAPVFARGRSNYRGADASADRRRRDSDWRFLTARLGR
jgi:hypothetical protein